MLNKTLNEYAAEVATLIGGKVVFTGPHSGAVVAPDGKEITLDGPACRNWRAYNDKLVAALKTGASIANL